MDPMEELKLKQRDFAGERDWEQFHSPKNLAMALSVEVAEIVEILQWLTEEESQSLTAEHRLAMQDEIGDVMNYLVRLSDRLDIEPVQAAMQKIEKNRIKYPVEGVKGTSAKHTEL